MNVRPYVVYHVFAGGVNCAGSLASWKCYNLKVCTKAILAIAGCVREAARLGESRVQPSA